MKNVADQNVAQLKDDIDSGKTGSKTAAADSGLSPLGTDDEAAGRPASPEVVAMVRAQEKRIGDIARTNDPPRTSVPTGIMIAVIVALAAMIVIAYMVYRE